MKVFLLPGTELGLFWQTEQLESHVGIVTLTKGAFNSHFHECTNHRSGEDPPKYIFRVCSKPCETCRPIRQTMQTAYDSEKNSATQKKKQ